MTATPAALELPPIRAWLSITQRNIVYAYPDVFDDVYYVIGAFYTAKILDKTKRGICRLEIPGHMGWRARDQLRGMLSPFNNGEGLSGLKEMAHIWYEMDTEPEDAPAPCTAIVPYTRPLAIVPAGFWK